MGHRLQRRDGRSIAGLLAGSPAALPDRWTAPLKNRLATSVADFDGTGFDTLAHATLTGRPPPMTHIAVLGSTNMDLVAYVSKAPQRGETVTGREFRTIPGGKGANQAVAAARAGADVSMIGAVGNDAYGTDSARALEQSGVNTDHLRTAEGASGTAHIVVDDEGGNAIVVVPAANGTVTGLAPGDESLIATADALLLQLENPARRRSSRAPGPHTATASARSSPRPPSSRSHPNSSPPPTCWCRTSTRRPPSPA